MESAFDTEPPISVHAVRHQLVLLRGAIALVASGASSRVTLSGLQDAELLLRPAREAAAQRGLIARISPHTRGHEITIEPSS
jgi:hypothetical protein